MVNKLTCYWALTPFLSKPFDSLHLAAISKELGEPHPTVRLWLNRFVERGILKKKTRGRLTEYKINLEHQNVIDHLVVVEKLNLIRKCEDSFVLRELVHHIAQSHDNTLIFGSAATDFKNANDIDILIIGRYDKKQYAEIEKKINKELHIISVNDLDKISWSLKNEIIKKHLIIIGTEYFLRWFIR